MMNRSFIQICIVTDDVDKAKKRFAAFFGFEEIPANDPFAAPDVAKVEWNGTRVDNIEGCSANFAFGNLQVEFIQPNDSPSSWRNWLNEHGESIHHVAFTTPSLDDAVAEAIKHGGSIEQSGICADGVSRYAYVDTKGALPCRVEMMEIPWLTQAQQ